MPTAWVTFRSRADRRGTIGLVWEETYDGLDRQTSHNEGPAAATAVGLHYDGLTTNVALETSTIATKTVDTVYELTPAGAKTAFTQYTPVSSPPEYLEDDGKGNLTTATGTDASLKCSARFDPFGNPLSPQTTGTMTNPCNTGDAKPSTYFFRGGRRDVTTGSYQLGSRSYDPTKAAFLTPDSYRPRR